MNEKIAPVSQKKSKSKSCDKLKVEKSPDRKSKEKKEKLFNNTMLPRSNKNEETLKAMTRTGANIPLPRHNIKSPTRMA